jgi:hypothetical protein
MTDKPTQGRITDLPLEERRRQDIETQRELADGLMRRHVANATYERCALAAQVARVPALAAKLRGE